MIDHHFPGSYRLTKGAIVGIDSLNPLVSIIALQYNREAMPRQLQASAAGDRGAGSEVLRLSRAPKETIDLTIEFDAPDPLDGVVTR